ncbi:MAG: hypothetical protein KTR23_05225 [Rhodospirillales bacterium]|nr:hypothetical protein [Rhodospirillales bacterium]
MSKVSKASPVRTFKAGPLQVRFEHGTLRYVRYYGIEILRAVSYVVRDRDWGTLSPVLSDIVIDETPGRFCISYISTCHNNDVELELKAEISGNAEGMLRFAVDATPNGSFETNRCGFNVLHPINGVAGQPVRVEHCNGDVEETTFPDLIEPWQPFKSIRGLTHYPDADLTATCRFLGDEFEMEDQRNWSDASFKTYVRPIELPWPYLLEGAKTNTQSIELSIEGGLARSIEGFSQEKGKAEATSIHVTPEIGSEHVFPKTGLAITPDEANLSLACMGTLRKVNPQVLLCHYDQTVGHVGADLSAFAALQKQFDAQYELEYVVVCDGNLDQEFRALKDDLAHVGFKPDSLLVCPSVDRQSTPPGSEWPDCPALANIYNAARKAFPDISLGGGMFSYFTELNRKRPPVDMLDFVTHATNPIVHAADDESVMETLETLPHIFRSARAILGQDKEYRLAPTTIAMRQNPYGSRTFPNPKGERVCMTHDDPRHREQFGAAWAIGYGMRISATDITRWVPAGLIGPRGIIELDDNKLFPIGEVIKTFSTMAGKPVLSCSVGTPKLVAAVAVRDGPLIRMLVANLTDQSITVKISNSLGRKALAAYGVLQLELPCSEVLN